MLVTIESCTENPVELIAKAARVCYDSKSTGIDSDIALVRNCINRGHESVLEHAVFVFNVNGISRACLAQLTRHRICSFSVRSQRFVKEDGFRYVIPESITSHDWTDIYVTAMLGIQKIYDGMIKVGIPKEDARYILPNACETNVIMTMNLREVRHFMKLRMDKAAQWEIRKLANKIFELIQNIDPVLVEGITQ
mgnify:CR=1 FL=1